MKPNPKPRRRASNPVGTLALYDGRTLLGSMVRHEHMFEAINARGRSVGLYPSKKAAVDALSKESANQSRGVK